MGTRGPPLPAKMKLFISKELSYVAVPESWIVDPLKNAVNLLATSEHLFCNQWQQSNATLLKFGESWD
jgi:hypothetical protein